MLALTPVTVKSTKSMLAMQRLQPEMKKLQAKYKGPENREMLNQEMMRLYKENGTSPFGACLPSLLQMPFLIVLVLPDPGSFDHGVPRVHRIRTGGQTECMHMPDGPRDTSRRTRKCTKHLVASQGQMHWWFGMDLSSLPFSNHTRTLHACRGTRQARALVIPYLVLIAAAMFLQYYQMKQMNSRNPQAAAANPQMQTMQKFFPIIFGVIYLRVPAGATIYMVVSSAMRIGTQEVMFRTGMVAPVDGRARDRLGQEGTQRRKRRRNRRRRSRSPRRRRPKKKSTATDGTALAKGTVPPAKTGSNGNGRGNGRKPAGGAGKRTTNGKAESEDEEPAPKAHPRSRSKRARKAR